MCTVCSSGDVQKNSISCHVFWIMSRVTVSMTDVILSCSCWIFLIFSAYKMFLMYPHRKTSSGERSGLRGGHGIGPPPPIQALGNLSFKTSVTKQLKCSKVTPSPARAHDSPPAWKSPQHLKVTHLRFPCQWRAPSLFKLCLILN